MISPYDFPFALVEIINAVEMIILFWMLMFLFLHLRRTLAHAMISGVVNSCQYLYRYNKPEIALTTLIVGLISRTGLLWLLRWMIDHRIADQTTIFTTTNVSAMLIASTATVVIGAACWIRVITPFSGPNAGVAWAAMIGSAVLFALGMHYSF